MNEYVYLHTFRRSNVLIYKPNNTMDNLATAGEWSQVNFNALNEDLISVYESLVNIKQ